MSLLLSTPPEGSQFYPNALRAVALSSAVSRSLHELAVKVNNLPSILQLLLLVHYPAAFSTLPFPLLLPLLLLFKSWLQ